ncbi:S-adenosyl-L-methionine-dependent methyltransferase [Rhexocercosporidium sp. MPI-PUGE-AT-0058]|nr:S-adenosyl-L-methionine-dependent methyltransferase [Rhexocercosporidium sp. MPI-PUGE-AT-0058]
MMAQSNQGSPLSSSPPRAGPQSPGAAEASLISMPSVAAEDFEEHDDDGDSAFGSARSDMTDTASLTSSILKFREENGRTYHAFGSTDHWGPNDEDAQEQQDISHHFWSLMLKGDLYLAPVNNPQRILDVGTGTGMWAIDVAEKHPEADVKGIDVSPIQPSWVPPNCRFELDDFNLEWQDSNKFDLIHARELLGSVPDWPKFYEKCFKALKPGGWIDCSEPGLYFESFYGTLGEDHPYKLWGTAMLEAGNNAGMTFDVAPYIKERLERAGFINIVEKKVCCTIGKWSKDPWEREVGLWEQLRLEKGVQDFCERRFINNLGWRVEEVQVFGAQMRNAVRNNRLLAHHWFHFVYGQKPPE